MNTATQDLKYTGVRIRLETFAAHISEGAGDDMSFQEAEVIADRYWDALSEALRARYPGAEVAGEVWSTSNHGRPNPSGSVATVTAHGEDEAGDLAMEIVEAEREWSGDEPGHPIWERVLELHADGHGHVSVTTADGHGAYCSKCGETLA